MHPSPSGTRRQREGNAFHQNLGRYLVVAFPRLHPAGGTHSDFDPGKVMFLKFLQKMGPQLSWSLNRCHNVEPCGAPITSHQIESRGGILI